MRGVMSCDENVISALPRSASGFRPGNWGTLSRSWFNYSTLFFYCLDSLHVLCDILLTKCWVVSRPKFGGEVMIFASLRNSSFWRLPELPPPLLQDVCKACDHRSLPRFFRIPIPPAFLARALTFVMCHIGFVPSLFTEVILMIELVPLPVAVSEIANQDPRIGIIKCVAIAACATY